MPIDEGRHHNELGARARRRAQPDLGDRQRAGLAASHPSLLPPRAAAERALPAWVTWMLGAGALLLLLTLTLAAVQVVGVVWRR